MHSPLRALALAVCLSLSAIPLAPSSVHAGGIPEQSQPSADRVDGLHARIARVNLMMDGFPLTADSVEIDLVPLDGGVEALNLAIVASGLGFSGTTAERQTLLPLDVAVKASGIRLDRAALARLMPLLSAGQMPSLADTNLLAANPAAAEQDSWTLTLNRLSLDAPRLQMAVLGQMTFGAKRSDFRGAEFDVTLLDPAETLKALEQESGLDRHKAFIRKMAQRVILERDGTGRFHITIAPDGAMSVNEMPF